MENTKRHDWGLIIIGILLIICGVIFVFSPLETLITLTIFAGAAFFVAGILDIINYVRFHKSDAASGWTVVYGILDILIGLMLLFQPIALAAVIPWIVGISVIIFGIFECITAFRIRKTDSRLWGWVLFSGIVGIIIGLLFFIFPASFIIYLAVFLVLRGVTLIAFGWNASPVNRW